MNISKFISKRQYFNRTMPVLCNIEVNFGWLSFFQKFDINLQTHRFSQNETKAKDRVHQSQEVTKLKNLGYLLPWKEK